MQSQIARELTTQVVLPAILGVAIGYSCYYITTTSFWTTRFKTYTPAEHRYREAIRADKLRKSRGE